MWVPNLGNMYNLHDDYPKTCLPRRPSEAVAMATGAQNGRDSGVEPAAGFSSAGLAAVFSDFALLSSSWEHPLASLLGFLKIDITYLRLIQ